MCCRSEPGAREHYTMSYSRFHLMVYVSQVTV